MPESPIVSVIIPAFNTAHYLGRAITSALNQTPADVEVLVVDDGSTDDTLVVAQRWADRDARVRVMTQSHGGVAKARNRAIAAAKAPYIALLDSDDEWMPGYLEAQLALLTRFPACSVVTTNAFNRGGPLDGQPYWEGIGDARPITLLEMVEHEDSVCIMSVFRREMHTVIGGYDETFTGGSEDYDFWLRGAAAGFWFVRSMQPLAYYQRRPDSMSARPLHMLEGICASLTKLRRSLRRDIDAMVCAAIDRKLIQFGQERLAVEAAEALRSRDYLTAASRFTELHASRGGARLGLVAAWCRIAPSSLAWIDAMRSSRRAAGGI